MMSKKYYNRENEQKKKEYRLMGKTYYSEKWTKK